MGPLGSLKANKPWCPLMSYHFRAVLVAIMALSSLSEARAEPEKHHALSLIRAPKYPVDFKHFDYVNPDAPKGGTVRLQSGATYDNLNQAVFRGNLARRIEYVLQADRPSLRARRGGLRRAPQEQP